MKNIKNIYSPLIWLVFGIIFLVIGLNNQNQTFLIFAGSDITIGCALLGIATKKKNDKDDDHGKKFRLKMARAEHDMTQGDLADAIGVTRQTIGLIEAGKYNPSLSLCLAICKCLNKTLDQLFWIE